MRGKWLRLALGVVAIASGPAALVAWNNGMGRGGFSSPVGGKKWFAPRPGFFETSGVKDPELSPTGTIFNWTESQALFRFPRVERSRPVSVVLRIQGADASPGLPSDVIFSIDGVETVRLATPSIPKRVTLDVPPRKNRGALVSLKVEGQDGVMVENVRLLPVGGSTVPIPIEAFGALAFVTLAGYVAAAIAGASPGMALIASLAEAAFVSWLSMTGGAILGRYSERLVWIHGLFLLSTLAATRIRDLGWRRAWIFVLLVTALKVSILGHPQIVDADAAGHAANLGRVVSGDWFFTSATPPPAISFPYPPGLYALALPFSGLPRDTWVSVLRVLALVAEIVATFTFSAVIGARSTGAVGALTFALLALAPEGISVLFIGNLSNLFSDALMILGCALLISRQATAASIFLFGGFLSHFGTLLLGAPLSLLLSLACGESEKPAVRRTAPVLLALLASFLLYYRRFAEVVIGGWDQMTTLKGSAAVGPMTAPLAEKLSRMGGGESWWLSVVIVSTVVLGIATWPREYKLLARILSLWLLVIFAFILLGLATPVQVRSALSARPAVFALCASGLIALWSRRGLGRVLASVVVALVMAGGFMMAVGFFPVKPS